MLQWESGQPQLRGREEKLPSPRQRSAELEDMPQPYNITSRTKDILLGRVIITEYPLLASIQNVFLSCRQASLTLMAQAMAKPIPIGT
jgi:hypothetical protein